MRNYQPSNRVPAVSLFLLIVVALLCALILGLIEGVLDSGYNLHLVIVFPLLAGAISGGAFVLAVRVGKVRSPRAAASSALIAAVLIFGIYQYVDYTSGFEKIGASSFGAYLTTKVKVGFPFTRSGTDDDDQAERVLGAGVYVYWLVELALSGGLAAWFAAREARQPFDESADLWYGKPMLVALADVNAEQLLLTALKTSDFQHAAQLLTTAPMRYPRTELWLRRSPVASEPAPDVYLNIRYGARVNRVYSRASGMLTAAELDRLLRAISSAPVR